MSARSRPLQTNTAAFIVNNDNGVLDEKGNERR